MESTHWMGDAIEGKFGSGWRAGLKNPIGENPSRRCKTAKTSKSKKDYRQLVGTLFRK